MSLASHTLFTAPLPAPNPRRVHLYLRERQLDTQIKYQEISLAKAEQKGEAHLVRNVAGQVPTLALPDGTHISESVSICRYLDLLLPPTSASQPALLGSSPYQAATIDQWIRRVEMRVMSALGNVWINVHPYTKPYSERMGIKRFEDFGEENKGRYLASLKWLDGLFKKSGSGGDNYLADLDPTRKADAKIGFSLADIILLTTVDFGAFIGLPIPKELSGLRDWHERVSARPSVVVEKNQAIHGKL